MNRLDWVPEDGFAAYLRGEYATALRLWRPLAGRGNAIAQSNLGAMYATGLGVRRDYAAALTWFRKAADQGDASAQFGLGFMYGHGYGVRRDNRAAASWYRKAADQGHTEAQSNLGVMCEAAGAGTGPLGKSKRRRGYTNSAFGTKSSSNATSKRRERNKRDNKRNPGNSETGVPFKDKAVPSRQGGGSWAVQSGSAEGQVA